VTHDSNVFRLSDSANAQALIGTPDRDDTVAVTTAGFKINKPYGLQRFELDAGVEDHHYSRFSYLDFTAVNYAAAWRWSFTPALHGNLTTDRSEYVDPYADVQARGQINRRTNRSTVFDAEYELDGAWRLVGGLFERTSSNSQPFTFEGDSKVHGGEAGVRYVYPSGTSMAYRFKRTARANTRAGCRRRFRRQLHRYASMSSALTGRPPRNHAAGQGRPFRPRARRAGRTGLFGCDRPARRELGHHPQDQPGRRRGA
jgi:exopolysaccharide biosynthesis operon protein EpsL